MKIEPIDYSDITTCDYGDTDRVLDYLLRLATKINILISAHNNSEKCPVCSDMPKEATHICMACTELPAKKVEEGCCSIKSYNDLIDLASAIIGKKNEELDELMKDFQEASNMRDDFQKKCVRYEEALRKIADWQMPKMTIPIEDVTLANMAELCMNIQDMAGTATQALKGE